MRKSTTVILAGSLMGTMPGVAAQTAAPGAEELAKAFGAREAVQQISLSPDGSRIAMIVPAKGRGAALVVSDSKDGVAKTVSASSGNPDRLQYCRWSTGTRLICKLFIISDVDGDRLGFTRMISLNADGSDAKLLSAKSGFQALGVMQNGGSLIDWGGNGDGTALMTRTFVPEFSTGTLSANTSKGLGVELVDTTTLRRRQVEPPRESAIEYISDGQGKVRVMGLQGQRESGYAGNTVKYQYRMADSRDWRQLSEIDTSAGVWRGFVPYAVDPAANVAYGFENQTGHTALYSVSLDGKATKTEIYARPDVDLDQLVTIGRQARVVGVSYVTDRRETEFFDPALKKLRASLGKALPGKLITFIDASVDENRLLLFVGSDVDPGEYYLFDKTRRELSPVTAARPQLADIKLAEVKAVTYTAGDGTRIPAYLTLPVGGSGKNLPAIVMPHGGPGARDEWGFDWLAQFFVARGYAVIQPNFRGSTGYGDAWYQKNGFQSWRTAIGDVNDAGRWLVKSGIADPRHLAIVGWSYGGYAALQSAVLDPDLFKAVVAIAPVTDLNSLREEARNFTSFPQVDAFIGHGAWVTEASPARNAARIKVPVLMFHGDRDMNVGIGESRLMAERLRAVGGKAELVEFKGLDHQLEDGDVRAQMLARADAFLRNAMP